MRPHTSRSMHAFERYKVKVKVNLGAQHVNIPKTKIIWQRDL